MAAPSLQLQRPMSVGRLSNLPLIKHPMAHMGNKKHLNVIGSNRGGLVSAGYMRADLFTEGNENLPFLRNERKHSRNPTWPSDKRRSSIDFVIRRRIDPEKLYKIIRERLTVNFKLFQHQFGLNDPLAKGIISKGAFSRVLYHLVGFVTMEDVGRLLQWLGLDSTDGVSFNKFITCFKERETNTMKWLKPFNQKELDNEKKILFPEHHLRNNVQHKDTGFITASSANALLKERCKHSDFDLRDHLLESCFQPGALIILLQLHRCLTSLGVSIDDDEMRILWSRYDLQNTGAVDAGWFFEQIGLDRFGHFRTRVRTTTPRKQNLIETPSIDERPVKSPSPEREIRIPSRAERLSSPDHHRPPSTDIISSLMRKMEQNYYSLIMSCDHFEHNGSGMMTKVHLKEVLREYGILMLPYDLEQLLERCNLRRKDHYVSYKDLLFQFMIRSSQGIAHRVIMDPGHIFSNRMKTPSGNLSAEEAEAKLVELLHKDFLKLLGTFQDLDPHNIQFITQTQFRNTIDRIFNMRVSDRQFEHLLQEIGIKVDGLVQYPEFLAIFNKKRYLPTNLINNTKPPLELEVDRESPTVTPEQPLRVSHLTHEENLPTHMSPAKVSEQPDDQREKKRFIFEGRFKPVHEIANIVQEKMKYNRQAAKEAFENLDRKKTGRISKTQLHYWLHELDVALHPTELQNLWRAIKLGKDDLVDFGELVDFFTHQERRKFLIDMQRNMKRAKAMFSGLTYYHNDLNRSKASLVKEDKQNLRDSLDCPNSDILEKIRPQVIKHWDELKKLLRDLDAPGYGTISMEEFKNLCHFLKISLKDDELNKICVQFDFNHRDQFHYLQFMQIFATTSISTERMSNTATKYDKNTHKIVYETSQGIVEDSVGSILTKIKKQLMKDWKNLRRAFKQADINKDGYLSVVEFKTCIRKIIKDIGEDELFYILSELDANLDGKISYDEFLLYFQSM